MLEEGNRNISLLHRKRILLNLGQSVRTRKSLFFVDFLEGKSTFKVQTLGETYLKMIKTLMIPVILQWFSRVAVDGKAAHGHYCHKIAS